MRCGFSSSGVAVLWVGLWTAAGASCNAPIGNTQDRAGSETADAGDPSPDNTDPEDEDVRFCSTLQDCEVGEICADDICVPAPAGDLTDTGCQTNEDCADGELCALSTGQCVAEAATHDPDIVGAPPCESGDVRRCGSKIGQCEYGTQHCVDGRWETQCRGGVEPTQEVCNGLDDDCDGNIPEDENDVDADGERVCDGDCNDADPSVNPIHPERCDGLDNNCDGAIDEGGDTLCDDGLFCNGSEVCAQGSCEPGTSPDCESATDACNDGICDEAHDACTRVAKESGAACEDGSFCTIGDTCQGGLCNPGPQRDCSAAGGSCHSGICDEEADRCDGAPVVDGTPCEDGSFCTVNDACVAGSCVGAQRDCSEHGGPCNEGICDEALGACVARPLQDGTICDDGQFCTVGDSCRGGLCQSQGPRDCQAATGGDICLIASCDEVAQACRIESATTDDNDRDGVDACHDCDDTNGYVYPGAPERCNGLDDDCDGLADEDFDEDSDGFTICSTEPSVFDCDDTDPLIYPGANERCNEIDDDCDGYIDEGCPGCDPVDHDGDHFSECDHDCNDSDASAYPGAQEICDGVDNDCNKYTTQNCKVSEDCNWETPDTDDCGKDLMCGCLFNELGECDGDYICTALCNASHTGPLNDTCAENQICLYDVLESANIHGCAELSFAPGTRLAGQTCDTHSDCRSNQCIAVSQGWWWTEYRCVDYCGSDAYCPDPDTVCRPYRFENNIDGLCWSTAGAAIGWGGIGESCSYDTSCDHGFCASDPNEASSYCSQPCCQDADCEAGYSCSLRSADLAASPHAYSAPGADTCDSDTDCPTAQICISDGTCGWPVVETLPLCLKNAGVANGRAGAACTENRDCRSDFCDAGLGVCIELCCSDSTCPVGLSCEMAMVETSFDAVTTARICLSVSTADVLQRR